MRKDGVGGVDGLNSVRSLTVSPDGKHLYAAADGDDSVAVFAGDETTASLTFVEVHKDGVGGVDGLNNPRGLTVSPDGQNVYATAYMGNSLAVFGRNPTTGALTFLEFHGDNQNGVDGLSAAQKGSSD